MKRIVAVFCLVLAIGIAGAYAGCGTCDKSVVNAAKHNDNFKPLVAAFITLYNIHRGANGYLVGCV